MLIMRKTKIKYPWTSLTTSKIPIFAMLFSVFHFLKHYYNGNFHISFFKALLQWYFPYFIFLSTLNKWRRNDPGQTRIGHSKFCRSTSCYLVKHNLVMAPKASLTYLPTTQAWMPLASALPESGSFRPVSRFSPIPVCPGSFRPAKNLLLTLHGSRAVYFIRHGIIQVYYQSLYAISLEMSYIPF
jgi:hypothetical protein